MTVKFHFGTHWPEVGQAEVGQVQIMNYFTALLVHIASLMPTWPTCFPLTYIGGSCLPLPPVTSRGWAGWAGWLTGSPAGKFRGTVASMTKEAEKARDLARIEAALDKIESVMMARAPSQAHSTFVQALESVQLKAIDRIVPLLERKARLLGLDAPEQKANSTEQSGSLAELEKKLALVK